MLGYIILGVVVALVIAAFFVLRQPKEYYPAESCFHTCPNSGACQDCDCGYP